MATIDPDFLKLVLVEIELFSRLFHMIVMPHFFQKKKLMLLNAIYPWLSASRSFAIRYA